MSFLASQSVSPSGGVYCHTIKCNKKFIITRSVDWTVLSDNDLFFEALFSSEPAYIKVTLDNINYFFFENGLIYNIPQVVMLGYLLQVEFYEAYVSPVYSIIQEIILHLFLKVESCH